MASLEINPTPDDIQCENQVVDLMFHPSEDVIAVGRINGEIDIIRYNADGNSLVNTFKHHKVSCRSLAFTDDGNYLATASTDKTIKYVDTSGGVLWNSGEVHDAAINKINIVNPQIVLSGDDNGAIKLWDIRSASGAVMNIHEHVDFISDMAIGSDGDTVIATSGDGTLSAMSLKGGKLVMRSDEQEDELLSIQIIKNESKVVVGTQEGILNIWSWGKWIDISDRFPGHPNSVEALVKIDEDTICTGSSDGIIRIVNIHPNKLLGVIGEHDDWPVERMRMSHDGRLLGTCSHDDLVKFWDVSYLVGSDDDDDEDEEEDEVMKDDSDEEEEEDASSVMKAKVDKNTNNFFDDL